MNIHVVKFQCRTFIIHVTKLLFAIYELDFFVFVCFVDEMVRRTPVESVPLLFNNSTGNKKD